MSCSLNSSLGAYISDYIGVIKGHTETLDPEPQTLTPKPLTLNPPIAHMDGKELQTAQSLNSADSSE